MTFKPLTDDQLFNAWDALAEKWGVEPPTNEGEQAFTALLLGAFFAGNRYREFIETHQEGSDLALPGFNFDLSSAERMLRKKGH